MILAPLVLAVGCSGLPDPALAPATRIEGPSGVDKITIIAKGLE